MKHLTIAILLFFSIQQSCQAQTLRSLIKEGIAFHDFGNYEGAIEKYNQALKIDSNSSRAHCEMALSQMHNKNYERAVFHSDKVITLGKKHLLQAYIAKGSAQDNLNRPTKAIATLKKGIKRFPDSYLLQYNLALTYYRIKLDNSAGVAATKAIGLKPNHSSSHYLLANANFENKKTKSILGLFYFLALEPKSSRSKLAYKLLQEQLYGNITVDKDKPTKINIFVNPDETDKDYGGTEAILPLLIAANYGEKNKGKSKEELFAENSKSLFDMIDSKKKQSLFSTLYEPFFKKLVQDNMHEYFCYYIAQSANSNARKWLSNHGSEKEKFINWLEANIAQ